MMKYLVAFLLLTILNLVSCGKDVQSNEGFRIIYVDEYVCVTNDQGLWCERN